MPPPKPQREPEFRQPGRPLFELVREADQAASDAAWHGDFTEADRLQSIADDFRDRLRNGELYEIDH